MDVYRSGSQLKRSYYIGHGFEARAHDIHFAASEAMDQLLEILLSNFDSQILAKSLERLLYKWASDRDKNVFSEKSLEFGHHLQEAAENLMRQWMCTELQGGAIDQRPQTTHTQVIKARHNDRVTNHQVLSKRHDQGMSQEGNYVHYAFIKVPNYRPENKKKEKKVFILNKKKSHAKIRVNMSSTSLVQAQAPAPSLSVISHLEHLVDRKCAYELFQ